MAECTEHYNSEHLSSLLLMLLYPLFSFSLVLVAGCPFLALFCNLQAFSFLIVPFTYIVSCTICRAELFRRAE